ncbi:MAG: hypothetical protein AAFX99_19455, partial [Myxococcota bacterium]
SYGPALDYRIEPNDAGPPAPDAPLIDTVCLHVWSALEQYRCLGLSSATGWSFSSGCLSRW